MRVLIARKGPASKAFRVETLGATQSVIFKGRPHLRRGMGLEGQEQALQIWPHWPRSLNINIRIMYIMLNHVLCQICSYATSLIR